MSYNKFLYLIACIVIIVGGIVIIYISKQFSSPISEISAIAKKMANLDFSQKYVVKDDDEINELGKNINIMFDQLLQKPFQSLLQERPFQDLV